MLHLDYISEVVFVYDALCIYLADQIYSPLTTSSEHKNAKNVQTGCKFALFYRLWTYSSSNECFVNDSTSNVILIILRIMKMLLVNFRLFY